MIQVQCDQLIAPHCFVVLVKPSELLDKEGCVDKVLITPNLPFVLIGVMMR